MEVKIVGRERVPFPVKVGDVLEFRRPSEGKPTFYLIGHIRNEGYYIMNLTGYKRKNCFYDSLDALLDRNMDFVRIYPKETWELHLISKLGREYDAAR